MLSEDDINKIKSVISEKAEIEYAIVFGSALKRLLPQSDVDLLIGGDLDRKAIDDISMALGLELKRPVDLVLSREARCEVVLRGFSSGMLLVVRDKRKVKEDYLSHYRLCDQKQPLKRVRLERLKRVYGNG